MSTHSLKPEVYFRLFGDEMKKADRRKISILQAGLDLLVTEGVDAVNYERIGKKTKMLRAHVAYYFSDKKDILRDIFKMVTETGQLEIVESIQNAKEPMEVLLGGAAGVFQWAKKYPAHAQAHIHLLGLATHDPYFRDLHNTIRLGAIQRQKALIESTGLKVKGGLTAEEAAASMVSALVGTLSLYFSTTSKLSLDQYFKMVKHHFLTCLEGEHSGESKRRPGKPKKR